MNRDHNSIEVDKNKDYDESLLLICTLSGRIIYATGELKITFGTEVSGKNLNDFLDDNLVSKIITNSANNENFYFDCVVGGIVYSGFSEKDGNAINIRFTKKPNSENSILSDNSIRYLQAELNSGLALMLGALQSKENRDDPVAMFARHNIHRLVRATKNVFDKIACDGGDERYLKYNCDVLELCNNIAQKIKFPLRSINVEIEVWHDGGRHICYCVPEYVERIIANMISCVLKGIVNNGKTSYVKIEIMENDSDVLVAVTSPRKDSTDKLLSAVLSKNDSRTDLGTREMNQTISTIKSLVAFNDGSLIISTDKDVDRMAVLLPKVPSDEKLLLNAPLANYSVGASIALIELAEILPDSVY